MDEEMEGWMKKWKDGGTDGRMEEKMEEMEGWRERWERWKDG